MTVGTGSNGGRDKRGRFAKGNKAARGNPTLVRMHSMRQAFRDAVTIDELQLLAMAMAKAAQAGDVAAARLVLEYTVGRPRQAEPAVALELGPLTTAQEYAKAHALLAQATAAGAIEPTAAVAVAHLLRHGLAAHASKAVADENYDVDPDLSYL